MFKWGIHREFNFIGTVVFILLFTLSQNLNAKNNRPVNDLLKTEQIIAKSSKKLKLRWITPEGEVLGGKWKAFSEWSWEKTKSRTANEPAMLPLHKFWVSIPSQFKFIKALSTDSKVALQKRVGLPKFAKNWKQPLSIQTITKHPSIALYLRPKKNSQEYIFLNNTDLRRTDKIIHSSCGKLGIEFRAKKRKEPMRYIAAFCEQGKLKSDGSREENTVTLFYPSDTEPSKQLSKFPRASAISNGKFNNVGLTWVRYKIANGKGKSVISTLGFIPVGEFASKENATFIQLFSRVKRRLASTTKASFTKVKTIYLSAGLGFTSLSFKETGKPDYSAVMTTGKVSGIYRLTPLWDLGGNAYFNIVPLSQTPSDRTLRVVGGNLRGGYVFSGIKKPWRLSLLAGVYYSHTLSTGISFGYQHLVFPQAMPVISRFFGKDSATLYLKYVPILHVPGREYAVGLSYGNKKKSGNTISYSVDYSNMDYDHSTTSNFRVESLSIGVGLGF